MGTGIFNSIGTEVEQRDIDAWCNICKYPTEGHRCRDRGTIAACWQLNAHTWHLLHECPFADRGETCLCNVKAQIDSLE